uniref:30S ribosomal protein S1 n=1 Tax=Chattonella marina TaxID=90936 RepID=UPI0021141073|nr:30S ribosomal protein S1 [Chattonella marina]UTE94879.1 30S ribosomal protein S1 [Chattonella marina]
MSIKFSSIFEKSIFVQLLKKYNYQFTVRDIVAGKIIGFEKKSVLIDIGAKTLAYLPISEISKFQVFSTKEIFSSDEIGEFILIIYNPVKKTIIVSLKQLKSLLIWQRLKELARENLIVSGQVEKSTKQGKLITSQGFKGFVSNYHLPKYYRRKQLNKLNLPLKFLKLSENNNKILMSCKLAHFKNQTNFLKVQQVITGCITDIKPYGLFVNIYGLKGLLHISEISSKRIENLTKLFKKGQLITVTILYINLNRGRISLSSKPFESVDIND